MCPFFTWEVKNGVQLTASGSEVGARETSLNWPAPPGGLAASGHGLSTYILLARQQW